MVDHGLCTGNGAMEGPWSLHEVYVSRYMGVKIMSKWSEASISFKNSWSSNDSKYLTVSFRLYASFLAVASARGFSKEKKGF